MTLQIIEDRAAFAALAAAWRALEAHRQVRPFQQHGWIAAWSGTLGARPQVRLKVATLWQGERLVGALPLCVRRFKGLRLLEWIASRVSDYCDALVDPGVDA